MPTRFDCTRVRVFFVTLTITFGVAWPVRAASLGNNFEISGPGCRFPDVAFGTTDSKYLVVWTDYNVSRVFGRFVTVTGTVSGAAFPISEAPFGSLYPAIAYNSASNEFLITWDDAGDRGGVIFGQRVRGSDGALMGTNFAIGTLYGGIRSAVAWSPVNNVYLVTYWGNSGGVIDIFGQRVSGNGALVGGNFNISNDPQFSGYPAVTWGASGNQFLVTWDNEDGNIYGRRVDPTTGALLGSTIIVTSGGGKDRSCIAYDSVNNRWMVQFNNNANAGFSYDQYGQLVNPDGSINGAVIPLAHTTSFEGDTQFGGDVAFVPGARRFFSSFGTDTGMGGQESLTNGTLVGSQIVLGTGYFTSLNNAADPQRNRFLTAWEGLVSGSFHVIGQLVATAINPVTNFTATAQNAQNFLSWRTPNEAHFIGTMIRVKTSGYPSSPDDGVLVVDQVGPPGATDSFTHTNLTNWITYYYSAFAHDVGPNYSFAAQSAATPRPAVVTISTNDFSTGTDSWTLDVWRAGTLSFGTITWEAASGSIVSSGSGASNNRDTCTREGSIMTKVISTVGRASIQVEYDVMASLNTPPSGAVSGSCVVLEGSVEDKLVVYYSSTGTNGPWTVTQILSEGVELPTAWTRKLINLSGVSAVTNNMNFALRFQWQFNSASDTGRVDNIRVLSGAITGPTPAIGLSAATFDRTVQAGQNLPNDFFRVNNTGDGVLNFAATDNASWLSVLPASTNSPGPDRTMTLGYSTAALAVGDYEGVVQITSTNAVNSPQTVTVNLHVIPTACFREPFDYYAGTLTMMGAANWNGTATNELQVENAALKISGGVGLFSAAHTVNCAGSNGLIAAQIKIKKGIGTGDFFWNIAFDDSGGNNLARWYGGSTIARGRVGNNITADMMLSSTVIWDDLYVKLDSAANTSEFFFNGVSFGIISHGTTPSNSVGSVRIERLDRSSAANDFVFFDSLTLGAIDTTPPRLSASRTGNVVALSWPAVGMGARLESTAVLTPPIPWAPLTNSVAVTNGRSMFTASTTNAATFYRLAR